MRRALLDMFHRLASWMIVWPTGSWRSTSCARLYDPCSVEAEDFNKGTLGDVFDLALGSKWSVLTRLELFGLPVLHADEMYGDGATSFDPWPRPLF